jgi:hypothetical protein
MFHVKHPVDGVQRLVQFTGGLSSDRPDGLSMFHVKHPQLPLGEPSSSGRPQRSQGGLLVYSRPTYYAKQRTDVLAVFHVKHRRQGEC